MGVIFCTGGRISLLWLSFSVLGDDDRWRVGGRGGLGRATLEAPARATLEALSGDLGGAGQGDLGGAGQGSGHPLQLLSDSKSCH